MKKVAIGSGVLIRFGGEKEIEKFIIVNPNNANFLTKRISSDSPFGKAVFNRTSGEVVYYLTPIGKKMGCKIVRVE